MTAIISVLNAQGIAIAADSAATVSSGDIKKVYNKSNKLFTLSKYHPVGIAIYNNADFMGIPWEALIKVYREQLGEKKFDTVEKYQTNFLTFLKEQLAHITPESRNNAFFQLCSGNFGELKQKVIKSIADNEANTNTLDPDAAAIYITPMISTAIREYRDDILALPRNSSMDSSYEQFVSEYQDLLSEIPKALQVEIAKKYPNHRLTTEDKVAINEFVLGLTKVAQIFEPHSGLVFMGFGEKEMYPSNHCVLVGCVIQDSIRYDIQDPIRISPGTANANIVPYAQEDVTMTVLTGVDPKYEAEVEKSIRVSFETVSTQVAPKLSDQTEAQSISAAIKEIGEKMISELYKYRWDAITKPLLDILAFMGKEDMAEMAESLVSITSLRRKFTSNAADESVGGPVDVAVITKGDGFVWIKRKHYFSLELNRGFIEKYFN